MKDKISNFIMDAIILVFISIIVVAILCPQIHINLANTFGEHGLIILGAILVFAMALSEMDFMN